MGRDDMAAGPSEVLFMQMKLPFPLLLPFWFSFSQAEHGVDSQVILVTIQKFLPKVIKEIEVQLKKLP